MRTIRDGSRNLNEVRPLPGRHSASVIILHGLGDSAEGFTPVAEMLSERMDHVKFIIPSAPSRPVTMNRGMHMPAWYDIVGLDDRSAESCDGLVESRRMVHQLLEQEAAAGIKYERMVVAGFSQGGALTLHAGLQLDSAEKQLAGLIVMSGYLPASKQFRLSAGLESTPVLHCHGLADPIVRHDWGTKTVNFLKEQGVTSYDFKSYAGLGHSLNDAVLRDVVSFLETRLPHREDLVPPSKSPSEMSLRELRQAVQEAGLSSRTRGFVEKEEFVRLLEEFRSAK